MNEPNDRIRVSLSMTFPLLDREDLADHLAPIVREAIASGGNFTSLFIAPDDDDDG